MQKILRKRILRELKENLFRYLALMFLIILGMYMVISIVAAADTVIIGTAETAAENMLEDGQFSVFSPLTSSEFSEIEKMGVTLEAHFYLDFKSSDGAVVRIFRIREKIDLAAADSGHIPQKNSEIFLEKRYCEEHGISVGDKVSIGETEFTVSGIGSIPDYEGVMRNLSDSSADSKAFGIGFVTDERYNMLRDSGKSVSSEEYIYAYRLRENVTDRELKDFMREFKISADDIDDAFFKEYWERTGGKLDQYRKALDDLDDGAKELSEGIDALAGFGGGIKEYTEAVSKVSGGARELSEAISDMRTETNQFLDEEFDVSISKMTQFVTAEDNPRIGAAADDKAIDHAAGLAAGVIVLVLFAYIISVFTVHGIERESGVIGTLYAMGVKKNELLRHYLALPTLVSFAAGIIGTAMGYSSLGAKWMMSESYGYFSMPRLDTLFEPYLLIYGIVMPPAAAAATNFLVIRKKLERPALALIRGEQRSTGVRNIRLRGGFVRVFQIRQLLRESRTAVTMFFGMLISLLIVMLSLNCYVLCMHIKSDSVRDTKFAYMYTYKYPEETVPEGGEEAYGVSMKKEIFGYNLDVTLLGIHSDSRYFDVDVERLDNGVAVSSAAAEKFHLKKGDILTLIDEENDRIYAFPVEDVVSNSSGFYAFMDMERLRGLMDVDDDYFNIVFSDRALDIDSGRLYSVLSRKDVEKSSAVFVEMMKGMVFSLTSASALIFVVIMYLMMKVMIDRQTMNISMFKIFGYRKKEIGKLYLNGNLTVVVLSALTGIPISKIIMDAMYPYLVSNVACSINLKFSWHMYAIVFAVIIFLYFVINRVLIIRINRILPAEALKNRE